MNPVLGGTDVDLVKLIDLDPHSPLHYLFSRRGWEWLVMDGWLAGCWLLSRGDNVFGRSWAVVLKTNPFFLKKSIRWGTVGSGGVTLREGGGVRCPNDRE